MIGNHYLTQPNVDAFIQPVISARVFLHSVHASLEFDFCQIFQALGMTLARGNMNRSYEERPCIPGYNDQDYGDAIRERVDNMSCILSDFDGCDMIMIMNPADFHRRVVHFSTFRPTVCYVNGQWIDEQMDELAKAINGVVDGPEHPRIWAAVYSKVEEDYLRKRVKKEFQERIHHIRFAKKTEDYAPWIVKGEDAPVRENYIYTTCNDIHNRPEACCWLEYRQARMDLRWRLSGRNTEHVGGQGLVTFDTMRKQMRECAAYIGVPCWPAPIVLNMIEAMCSGAPVAFYDNGRGVAHEGIFNDGVGCCSKYVEGLRSFLKRCVNDKGFREDQSAKSLVRAKEFFDFDQQMQKWEVLFSQMAELWK